ncbi:hypothetical protein PMAYCL1PPCAC_08970, partial [Pristionchus mayeri]
CLLASLVLLLSGLISLVLSAELAAGDDNEEPGTADIPEPAKVETLQTQFTIMGIVNIVLSVVFGLVSCWFYTMYRSKGSDD